jgi:hypothetical protein
MTSNKLIPENHLLGFITERNLDQAEESFPGIGIFYERCGRKPRTFLDLVWQFENALLASAEPCGQSIASQRGVVLRSA